MSSSASSSSPPSEASLSQSTISQHLLHLILDKMGLCRHLFLDSNLEAWQQEIEALVLDSDVHSLLSTFLSDEYVRINVASYVDLCLSTPSSSSLSRSRSLAQPSHGDKKIHRAFTSERLLAFFKKAIAEMESLCEWEAMEIISASFRYHSHNPNSNPNPFFCPDVFCRREFHGFKHKEFKTIFRRLESFHGRGHDDDHHDGNIINSLNCIDFYFLTLHTLAWVSAIDLAKTRIHMHQCRVLQLAYNRMSHFFREFVQFHVLAGTWRSFLSTLSLFHGVGKELCRLLIHGHRYLEDYNRHGWSSLSIPNMLSQSRLMTFLEDLDFLCKHLISKAQIILDMSSHNRFTLPNLDLSELQFFLTKAAEYDHQTLHAELQAFCSDTGQAQQIEQPSPRNKPSHDEKSPRGKSILRSIWSNIRPDQSPQTPSRDDSFQSDVLFKARWLSQSLLCHIKLELENSKNLFIAPEYVKRGNLLGEGSSSKVYEATCWGDKYAMKQLYADVFSSRDEIFLQFRLPHPNIVRVIGYTSGVEGNGVRALLMELMSNDLRSHLDSLRSHSDGQRSPFQQVVAVDIMLQIAKAMEHLHRQQILHRDLKSSNVLIDGGRSADYWKEGYLHVKVADFGHAREFQKRDLTAPIGTSRWRAPEITSNLKEYKGLLNFNQGSSTVSMYDLRADVYSFGITCFEIVSGELPYEQESVANTYLLRRIVGGFRPTLPGEIHSGLAYLIKACWDGNPEQRPPFTEICTTLNKIKSELLHDV